VSLLLEVGSESLPGELGDPDSPDSQGSWCIRGQASREIIGNAARVLHPRRGCRHSALGKPPMASKVLTRSNFFRFSGPCQAAGGAPVQPM